LRSLILIFALLGIFAFTACADISAPPPSTSTRAAVAIQPTSPTRAPTATTKRPTNTRAATTAPPITPTNVPPTATSTATRQPKASPTPDGLPATLAEWQQTVQEIAASPDPQAQVNALWDKLVRSQREPLTTQDGVVFLYRGDATSVYWHGDFSFWEKQGSISGQRIPNTDLWYGTATFPQDSRTDYQIVLNDAQEILDPANPRRRNDGLDYNNVLTMPAFQITDFTRRGKDAPKGAVTDWIVFDSQVMGEAIEYQVYTPPNYDALENLPVLYVTDGERFAPDNIGAMNAVLDNLIAAKRITPVMAVYIDERDPNARQNNRRVNDFLVTPEKFAQFIAQELVPTIDAQYHTDAAPRARVLVGASFGGVFGTYAALRYPDVFGNLAAFSPAYWVLDNPNGANSSASSGGQRMSDFIARAYNCAKSNVPCPASPQKFFFSSGIPGWDVGDLTPRIEPLRARGDAVQYLQIQEGHNWGAWSGLTDEMLEYFFAAP
jgi:enterochelin esterase-like enzyme